MSNISEYKHLKKGVRVKEAMSGTPGTITEVNKELPDWCTVSWDDGQYQGEEWLYGQDFVLLVDPEDEEED